jgi:hypothetical protein
MIILLEDQGQRAHPINPTRKDKEKEKEIEKKQRYLPKLLRSVFSCDPLQNFCSSRMLIHKVGHVVNVLVDDDIETVVGVVVCSDVGGSEGLRHIGFLSSFYFLSFWGGLIFSCLWDGIRTVSSSGS